MCFVVNLVVDSFAKTEKNISAAFQVIIVMFILAKRANYKTDESYLHVVYIQPTP